MADSARFSDSDCEYEWGRRMRPIQNIAQHVRAMVAERDLYLRDVIPDDYPAWPASLVAKARDIDRDRAAAINRQLEELRDVMVELGLNEGKSDE